MSSLSVEAAQRRLGGWHAEIATLASKVSHTRPAAAARAAGEVKTGRPR